MKRNFIVDQAQSLKESDQQDITLNEGLCFAMIQDWLLSEMLGIRKGMEYYMQSYRFCSRQRVINDLTWLSLEKQIALRNEPHKILDTTEIYRFKANMLHLDNRNGFYFIYLSDYIDSAHCIGVSITQKKYRVFDPNHGEFECYHGNENISKRKLGNWINNHYSHQESPKLKIIRLALK